MQAVRQVKIMVSKENFKLVSQFKKNMSLLCPLITSVLLYVVKALHGRSPYHCIVQKIREFRGLALTKLTIFTVVSKTSFNLSGIPLAARASRWMLQCTQVTSGATACTRITTTLCLPVTLKVLKDILTAIDKKHYCAAVFIDLAKAFDSVNHNILIGRLDSLGFSNDCLAWFTNYFSDRVQCVKSEGLLSGPLAVSMGVPHGSILGPTLFSVYINEVALAAGESLIHLYADDTILYTSGHSLDTVLTTLQASFNAIQLSSRGLQLLLNTSKTKCMLFNRSLPAPARLSNITTLDGSDLEYVDNYKYLGVWLDCKLSFQTHIKHLQSKVKSRIGFLFRNKASFTHAAKHTLVKLTILPILDFGDVIYKIASNTLLNKLDADYHSAIRFVTKAPYTTHHCDLYALVGWTSLHNRRQIHWLHVIYKTLLGKVPPYLSSLVTIASPTCSTRSSRYISLVTPKTNYLFGRLSFQFSAANDWNELQKSLKLETLISLTSFKHQLSEQLTDYCTCT
uniref:Reverse transcriptase domain-containing protein n=1 Tax=Oncorhynchus mykiss TaxID=8022 RepID=A0A8K9X5I7_ONCMY